MTSEQSGQVGNSRTNWWQFWVLTGGLVLVLLLWGVHAGFDVVGYPLRNPLKDPPENIVPFWKVWEVSSVFVTWAITIVYWRIFIKGQDGKAGAFQECDLSIASPWFRWRTIFFCAFLIACVFAVLEWWIPVHVGCLALGLIAAVKLGKHAMTLIHSALERQAREFRSTTDQDNKKAIALRAQNQCRIRDNISKYRCFSDVPIAFAMIVLAVLVSIYYVAANYVVGNFDAVKGVQLRSFVAGAVALQLLYSNLVWWIEAFADTPCGRKRLDRLPSALHPIKRMLHPEEVPKGMTVTEWAEAEFNRLFPQDNATNTVEVEPKPTPDASSVEKHDDAAEIPAAKTGDD